jgi:hypothetical protein
MEVVLNEHRYGSRISRLCGTNIDIQIVKVIEPIIYRGVLLTALLYAVLYVVYTITVQLLVQIANKMGLQEKKIYIGWGGVDWIGLAQDRDKRIALVNAVMNLRVP